MEQAFAAGYDPALEVAKRAKSRLDHEESSDIVDHELAHLRRKEQDLIDRIVSGEETGHYWMLLGPKVFPLFTSFIYSNLF